MPRRPHRVAAGAWQEGPAARLQRRAQNLLGQRGVDAQRAQRGQHGHAQRGLRLGALPVRLGQPAQQRARRRRVRAGRHQTRHRQRQRRLQRQRQPCAWGAGRGRRAT